MAQGKPGAPIGNKNAAGGKGGLRSGLAAGGTKGVMKSGALMGAGGDARQQARFVKGATIRGGTSGFLKGAAVGAIIGGVAGADFGVGAGLGAAAGSALGGAQGGIAKGAYRREVAKGAINYGMSLKPLAKSGDLAGIERNVNLYSRSPERLKAVKDVVSSNIKRKI